MNGLPEILGLITSTEYVMLKCSQNVTHKKSSTCAIFERSPKGYSKSRFHAAFSHKSPRNFLKFMFTPSLPNHAGCQIDHSRKSAIFHPLPVFTL